MTETHETQTLPTQPAPTRRRKTWIVGGAAAVAVLAGGVGIGAAFADGDDDDDRTVSVERVADTARTDGAQSPAAATTVGTADAGVVSAVLTAARTQADGEVTSIDANRDGSWDVDLETTSGDETTVRVEASGAATVVETDRADADDADDRRPAGTLDDATLNALVAAALAEANGSIIGIDVDDDPREAFTVTVLDGSGLETEIDVDTSFAVTKTEEDRD